METSEEDVAARPREGKAPVTSGAVRRAQGALLDLIWPQRSLISNRELPGPGAIELEHWARLTFCSGPMCVSCGTGFEIEVEPGQLCGACIADKPAYDRARGALIYGDISRDLVLALKHGRRDGLNLFAGWMAQAGEELLAEADLIVPTPLHYLRLVTRGFNQSMWLAAALGRRTGVRVSADALMRVKRTPMQGGLSHDARRRNVQGAFKVRKGRENLITGKRVLLIDDVFTTGATAEACARALKRQKAASVDVLTLARVAAPRRATI